MTTKRVLATNDHGGPIKLSPGDQVHANHTGENFKVHKTLNVNLLEWPHLSLEVLAKYERAVIADPNLSGVPADIRDHPVHGMSYHFPLNESKYIEGFDISKGGRAFTMYPRLANSTTNKLERFIQGTALPGSSGDMRENHVQHSHIHPKGLPHKVHISAHKHFVFPSGAKIDRLQIAQIVQKAVELGLIYPPGFESQLVGRDIQKNPRLGNAQRGIYEQKLMASIIIQ